MCSCGKLSLIQVSKGLERDPGDLQKGKQVIQYNSLGSSDASTQEKQLQKTGRKRVQSTADRRKCGERKPSLPGRKRTMV